MSKTGSESAATDNAYRDTHKAMRSLQQYGGSWPAALWWEQPGPLDPPPQPECGLAQRHSRTPGEGTEGRRQFIASCASTERSRGSSRSKKARVFSGHIVVLDCCSCGAESAPVGSMPQRGPKPQLAGQRRPRHMPHRRFRWDAEGPDPHCAALRRATSPLPEARQCLRPAA